MESGLDVVLLLVYVFDRLNQTKTARIDSESGWIHLIADMRVGQLPRRKGECTATTVSCREAETDDYSLSIPRVTLRILPL